jgi:hypothetical protein
LFGAVSDLDLGEAKIPDYTPPGMPDVGTNNQMYGTDTLPASAWAVGKDEANEILTGKKTKKTKK